MNSLAEQLKEEDKGVARFRSTPSNSGRLSMAGYFSFGKVITTYFVKTIYALGFILLTFGGIGLAAWAGLRLDSATIPTSTGVYFIAAGVGIVLVGNLAWRMICEFWILLFNMHTLLASIEEQMRAATGQRQVKRDNVPAETEPESIGSERTAYGMSSPQSVLGLS
jgi:multisubunit Na+/H+ antiporter MnhG subunit